MRPLRNLFRLVRLVLMSIGLLTTARLARDPDVRREAVEALAHRFPVEGLLEELAVEIDAARAAVAAAQAESEAEAATAEGEGAAKPAATQRRRPTNRTRGDTNGRHERKPPNRGTRAA